MGLPVQRTRLRGSSGPGGNERDAEADGDQQEQLAAVRTESAAVRTACAQELGHPVDRDAPASHRDDLEEEHEAPSEPWTAGGVPAGVGCLAAVLVFLAIRMNGLVALFD
ncbi:DUF6584 family protein [Streptomyces sp. NPDC051051]|uniref:DUF6584 family protein n=1 Tax=Streptomyces sp. NPDC051051 TaxID=3155666 RepID=UPI003412F6F4